ncbi:MAG: hypothetical protein JWR10_2034 [Rubritepida sp.]|nr:hypothetical protein [Rubritepida sp.]
MQTSRQRLALCCALNTDDLAYGAAMHGWLREHPEAVLYDWLFDLRVYRGTVSHDEVARFATAYEEVARGRDAGTRAVYVSPDPTFPLWVRACSLSYTHRTLTVVQSMAEAELLLKR